MSNHPPILSPFVCHSLMVVSADVCLPLPSLSEHALRLHNTNHMNRRGHRHH